MLRSLLRSTLQSGPLACAGLCWVLAAPAQAEDQAYTNFSQFKTLYLLGTNWDLGPKKERDVLTVEYFSDWKYGDTFFFVDISNIATESEETPLEMYGEFSPRFSFSKMTGKKIGFGPVKDVLLSTTVEMGSNPFGDPLRYLLGVGLQLDVPVGAASLDLYYRDDVDLDGSTYQVTFVWFWPFAQHFSFSGFIDYAGEEDTSVANIVAGPRLMFNPYSAFTGESGPIEVGLEVAYWMNEFGIDGQDEFVPQLALQWSF